MIRASIGYMSDEVYKNLDWETIKTILTGLPDEKPTEQYNLRSIEFQVDYEAAHKLVALGLNLEIKPMPNAMFVRLADKYLNIGVEEHLLKGSSVQIHIPNLGLLALNEVTWLEDACTEDVQRLLTEGWRIIAVCPPNAQRRPDYIFGRNNPSFNRGSL